MRDKHAEAAETRQSKPISPAPKTPRETNRSSKSKPLNSISIQSMKRAKLHLIPALTLGLILAASWIVSNSLAATETPDFELVRTDNKFEIRDYPALTVATTPMEGESMNASFRQLFRYITGENEGSQKIAMTAPVLIATAGEKRTMSFIMPKSTAQQGTPKPAGSSVTVAKLEPMRVAVLRFDGSRTSANEQAAAEKLRAWLVEEKLAAKGEPSFAYYDPPWTPTFMRRNEVMLRIEKPKE